MSDIVQKLWGFCHTLRHDGVDYGDYIEQLTYLLFLKMAEERGVDLAKVQSTNARGQKEISDCSWSSLKDKSGTALTDHYADILRKLREAAGLLGDIFAQATPRFNNPVNLKRVIAMIDEEDWSAMDVDVKGAAFEGLLEKAASEGKKGAGQYFTPRPLIQTICKVMKPDPRGNPDFRMSDPACGTGGCHLGAGNHSEPTAEILLSGNPNTGSSATSALLLFYRDARQNEQPRYVPEQKQICLYFPLDQFLAVQTSLEAGKNRRCFFRSVPAFDEAWSWIEVS